MKKKSKITGFMAIAFITIIVIIASLGGYGSKKDIATYSENDEIINKIRVSTQYDMIKLFLESTNLGPIPTPDKIAYITIDDGPSKYTNQILNILKENDVKATFFMIERNMINFKEEVKNVRDQGHSVGFHSVTHDIKQLYKTPEATLNEFDTCNNTYYDITGYESKLIRLPYGSKPYMPQESHDKLIENGYIMWDWNLDTQDWRATTDNIVSNVLYYARDKQHLVLLMHEKEQTVNALDPMIKVLKQRGYTIMPITEKIEPRNFWEKNL